MFRTVPLPIIRSLVLCTQQQVYVIHVMLTACQRDHPDSARKLSANQYDIYLLLCVLCWTPDDGQRNCPTHVDFSSKNKNKFEILVHLVGFSIRICHDTRSSEYQIRHIVSRNLSTFASNFQKSFYGRLTCDNATPAHAVQKYIYIYIRDKLEKVRWRPLRF